MIKPFWKKKKVWAAVIPAVVVLVNEICGLDLEPEVVAGIVLPFIAFIIGESWIDSKH